MSFSTFYGFAGEHSSHVALVEPDEHQVTAGELLASVNQLVHGLRALGLQHGDTVAALLPNSRQAMELYLAVQQAGWYLVPINFHLIGPEIAYLLQDSEASVLVAHQQFAAAVGKAVEEAHFSLARAFAVGGEIPRFRAYDEITDGQPTSMPAARTLGRLMNYTSGTTGRPKGVRRRLSAAAPEVTNHAGGLLSFGVRVDEPDHVHLLACPWYHTAPMAYAGPSLHLGHTLVIMDRFTPEKTLELIERYKVTTTHLVPTQFVRLLNLPDEVKNRYDVSSLRHVIHGAAPCAPDVKRRMIEWFGPVIDEYYYSTEGVGGATIGSEAWLKKPGSVGRPVPGNEIVILDDDGKLLPPGREGTIYSTPAEELEYYKDPEKTARAKLGKYATVGDVGYVDEDGYLYLCDRKTDMIISGGVNIYPAEIEGALVSHPKVGDAAVFGIPSEEWGEEVKAVVEPQTGIQPGEGLTAELMEYLGTKLARYKLPKSIEFTDALPRDPNGKLYKRTLRESYWAGRARAI
jgi:long-chain acyl-CoA synthetase